jgi:hypothetical protein
MPKLQVTPGTKRLAPPQLPPHWHSPVAAAVACVACGALIESSASLSPLADRSAHASEISAFSAFALRFASLGTEVGVLIALTLIGGLVLLSQRAPTPEAKLLLALQITTIGFTIALLIAITGFMSLFLIPRFGSG